MRNGSVGGHAARVLDIAGDVDRELADQREERLLIHQRVDDVRVRAEVPRALLRLQREHEAVQHHVQGAAQALGKERKPEWLKGHAASTTILHGEGT